MTGNPVSPHAAAPLDGVKVLEMGTVIMVPYAGKVLRLSLIHISEPTRPY